MSGFDGSPARRHWRIAMIVGGVGLLSFLLFGLVIETFDPDAISATATVLVLVLYPSLILAVVEVALALRTRWRARKAAERTGVSELLRDQVADTAVITSDVSGKAKPTGAGWLPDPTGRHTLRYWDGTTWTDWVWPTTRPSLATGSEPHPVEARRPRPQTPRPKRSGGDVVGMILLVLWVLVGVVVSLWVAGEEGAGEAFVLAVAWILVPFRLLELGEYGPSGWREWLQFFLFFVGLMGLITLLVFLSIWLGP